MAPCAAPSTIRSCRSSDVLSCKAAVSARCSERWWLPAGAQPQRQRLQSKEFVSFLILCTTFSKVLQLVFRWPDAPMIRCPDLPRVSVVGVSSLFGRRGLFRYQRGHGAIVLRKVFLRRFPQIIFCDLVIAVNRGEQLVIITEEYLISSQGVGASIDGVHLAVKVGQHNVFGLFQFL